MSQVNRKLFEDQLWISHSVGPNVQGTRLDAFLKTHYRRKSRESLKKDIDAGKITLERRPAPHLSVGRLKPSTQLLDGDRVIIRVVRKPEPEVCFDYRVIHEDEWILVIDKPGNLPVHPAGSFFFHTLLTHLRTQGFTAPMRAEEDFFLAHRIDKETSGILVLAKDSQSCAAITAQFAGRQTRKRYLAIVHGIPPEQFESTLPLGRDPDSRIKLKMTHLPEEKGGWSAHTELRRLSVHQVQNQPFSVVEAFPKTGRQHQIRVHLALAGFPIVGDKLYSIPEDEAFLFYARTRNISPEVTQKLILPRHALHAAGIQFTHPRTQKIVEFRSDLPEDLARYLRGATDASVRPSWVPNVPDAPGTLP